MTRWLAAITAALAFVTPAIGAESAPACSSPEHRQWDFWLGDWTVSDPAGKLQGTNRIVRASGGCGLEEHWTGASGGRGDSLNVYDPIRKTWTQLWAGPTEVIRLEGVLVSQGAMRMEGSISNASGGPEHRFRGVWTPLPDGAVRQEFFEQDPATSAWSNWFTGIYRRTASS